MDECVKDDASIYFISPFLRNNTYEQNKRVL